MLLNNNFRNLILYKKIYEIIKRLNNIILKIDGITGEIIKKIQLVEYPYSISISADGNFLACANGGVSTILDVQNWKIVDKISDKSSVHNVRFKFIPGSSNLLILSDDEIVNWDYRNHLKVMSYPVQSGFFRNFDLIPGTKQFVTASTDSLLLFWDISKNKPISKPLILILFN